MPHAIEPSRILKDTYERLHAFQKQLEKSIVTDSDIKTVIDFLHKESTILTRHATQSSNLKDKVSPVDMGLKNDILTLIQSIVHSPSCNQALGSQQMEFSNLLKKFELAIRKWESKVEKIDHGPL